MTNTMWALIIPNAVAVWNIIIMRTFFQQSIPFEIQESAQMDGCGNFKILLRIILPLDADFGCHDPFTVLLTGTPSSVH